MTRDDALREYRKILSALIRHHQAMDRHVSPAAIRKIAKAFGYPIVDGVVEADDDRMALVSDMAFYGRLVGSTRAIDRYRRALGDRLDPFDRALLEAASANWFSIFRLVVRHPVAGWRVDDLCRGDQGLWLMNEGLEKSGRGGLGLGARVFRFGDFLITTGAAAPIPQELAGAVAGSLSGAGSGQPPGDRQIIGFFQMTNAFGLRAEHRKVGPRSG